MSESILPSVGSADGNCQRPARSETDAGVISGGVIPGEPGAVYTADSYPAGLTASPCLDRAQLLRLYHDLDTLTEDMKAERMDLANVLAVKRNVWRRLEHLGRLTLDTLEAPDANLKRESKIETAI